MSSPHLNNLIILGCMCTYLSVIFLGLDSGLSGIQVFPYGEHLLETNTHQNFKIEITIVARTQNKFHADPLLEQIMRFLQINESFIY